MRRFAKLLLQPFWRLARWCARPLVRRCDAHLAHVVRTVLYHEPQSAAAWLNHLHAMRDELVVTIAQTRQPNSAAPGPDPVGLSELSLLLDSMIREIMRLERQVAALNSELQGSQRRQSFALTPGSNAALSDAA